MFGLAAAPEIAMAVPSEIPPSVPTFATPRTERPCTVFEKVGR
jgi:hypothetical protein